MAYCDINIPTSFANRDNVRESFGVYRVKKMDGYRNYSTENKLRNLNSCVISRKPLMRDLGGNPGAVGAFLTSKGLKDIKIVNVDGLEEGKRVFNNVCSKIPEDRRFYKKFCKDKKLREDLSNNKINDIEHVGSAIKLGERDFITGDERDLKPIETFSGEINVK